MLAELHQLEKALSLHPLILAHLTLLSHQRVLKGQLLRGSVHLRVRHLLLALLRLALRLRLRLALRSLLLALLSGGRAGCLRGRLLSGWTWSPSLG